jgi:hypothetical protein
MRKVGKPSGALKPPKPSKDKPTGQQRPAIVAAVASVLGIVIAILAWLFPR